MRLVLVHGINQQGRSAASIEGAWRSYLRTALGRDLADDVEVVVPFYGDELVTLTDARAEAFAQGADGQLAATEEAVFLAQALGEQAQAAGISANAIRLQERAQAGEVVAQGFPMDRRIIAIVRVLERLSPLHGDLVLHLLRQAYAYLKKASATTAVDAIVRPALDTAPTVVVSHSLGTVVTYKLLRQLALEGRPGQVPLYVTLGSPLPLLAVQAALGPPFAVPRGVARWLNAVDPDDFIALGRGLDRVSFADGIENLVDIDNVPDDPHSIEGYLGDRRVAEAIAAACEARAPA